MSDPNEPTGPEGSADQPAHTPPPSEPPPPPSPDLPPPPPPGDTYAGAAGDEGGYGAPPPASPYGQPAGGAQEATYSPTEAFGYGWRKFSASPGTLLLPMIVAWVGIVVTAILVEFLIVQTMLGTHDCTKTVNGISFSGQCSPSFFVQLLGAGLAIGIITVVSQILIAGLYKGAANIADGKSFSLGTMFDGWDKAQVVIAAILIAVATAIGTILCYIPGLIVGFLTIFTILFVVDKQLTAVDAIKASFELVTKNFANTFVFWILAAIALFVGALLCGIGLLVAAPVVLIALAYTYRRLQGEPVAP
jgi:uncharacterized membrane protein